ncbi:MAG: hypothetical protein KU38_09680 [Sulfurovum sp. FS08-3]|nr:MAG: hypothetical protein KU38_09680 [Sulfurovum sp. FS08-3]
MNAIIVGRKKLDFFFILISFFMMMLIFLVIYVNKSNRDMKYYTIYHKEIKNLSILDQKIENTLLKKYRYIDYDELQDINHEFQSVLKFLDNEKFLYKFDKNLKNKIALLYTAYNQKESLIEEFKATNARPTNSIHYLYDLHQSIEELTISSDEKRLFLNIFFQIEQLVMDIPNDLSHLQADVDKINAIKQNNKLYDYFYQHTRLFIKDIEMMKNILKTNEQLDLYNTIKNISYELEKYSAQMYERQYTIFLIFIIFGCANLILLIVNYKKIYKLVQNLFTFKYVIEKSENIIIITDKNRKIEYVNETFKNTLGYRKEEVVGQQDSLIASDLMSKETYENINETLLAGQKWEGELISRKKDGSPIYEKTSIVPIINKDKIQGYLFIKFERMRSV